MNDPRTTSRSLCWQETSASRRLLSLSLRAPALAVSAILLAALSVGWVGATGPIPCDQCDDNYLMCLNNASSAEAACKGAAESFRQQHCGLPGGGEDEFCLETYEEKLLECEEGYDRDIEQCGIISDNCSWTCFECEGEHVP